YIRPRWGGSIKFQDDVWYVSARVRRTKNNLAQLLRKVEAYVPERGLQARAPGAPLRAGRPLLHHGSADARVGRCRLTAQETAARAANPPYRQTSVRPVRLHSPIRTDSSQEENDVAGRRRR